MLKEFGTGFLRFLCSPDIVATRRLMIAEANRAGVGKLFHAKITALRAHIEAFLRQLMASGALRDDNPILAAEHLRALLEAEIIEPLLLQAREHAPDEKEIAQMVERAVAAFLRAYAPSREEKN